MIPLAFTASAPAILALTGSAGEAAATLIDTGRGDAPSRLRPGRDFSAAPLSLIATDTANIPPITTTAVDDTERSARTTK
ncbi:MAG: hypothetical protein JO168_14685 [Solirubrobacterales bacterium]|nr:hypothetical protein [Solirubrobacterales bacterium]MBV9717357.1 hypothetical protein [Solirubrobacterales bacterium]